MNVNAGLATGTGTALSLSMAQAGLATGTGTAGNIAAGYTAGLATGTGAAFSLGIGILAGLASADGDAMQGRMNVAPLSRRVMPQLQVLAQFDTDRSIWSDISPYVRSGTVDLTSTRTAGPLIEYEAGTASLVLKNGDGRFDPDNLHGPYVDQGYQMVVRRFYQLDALETGDLETSQHHTWTSPYTGTVKIRCIAAGGGGGIGTGSAGWAGGGGGEQAIEPIANVTAGHTYDMYIGGGNPNGANGPDTWMIVDGGLTIRAHGGHGATSATGGVGGTGSTNSLHLDGGAGGDATSCRGGGGGGGSGGDALPGNAGTASDSDRGAPGGPAVPGGGTGGTGGNVGRRGQYPIGSLGAGGGGSGAGGDYGGDGGDGMVEITWFVENTHGAFQSMVRPMVPIQIAMIWTGITYFLFTGYADAWTDTGLNVPEYRETNLTCTDGFKALAGIQLPMQKPTGGNEYTGLRIQDILDAAGWPEEHRWIQQGTEKLQATQYGDSALSLLQLSNMTEGGELFIDKVGSVHFRQAESMLDDARTRRSQALFGDNFSTGELPYTQAIRLADDTQLVNDVQVTRQGGILQEVTDWTSAFVYRFIRSWSTTSTLQISDAKALAFAQWVLNGAHNAVKRFDTIIIHPMREPDRLYPEVLTRERGDRITIVARPPDADIVREDVIVRGLHFTWNASSQDFTATYDLTDTDIGHEEF